MSGHRTCSRGHNWQIDEATGTLPAACPRCAQPAIEHDRSAATIILRSLGAALDSPAPDDSVTSSVDTLARGREEPRETQADFRIPTVPGYTILEELGRGGMGVVFKARQDGLGRMVALKMIQASAVLYPDIIARFRAEAESIASLHHPNIIQIHEIGTCSIGPYLVMGYADGGSLGQRLAGLPQPARLAATMVRTLALAIQDAHEAGVIHRDLKPANILLVEGKETPLDRCTPKISDFGLARRLDEAQGLTLSGQVIGTPGYMAPEQARSGTEAGPAADIYALGVLLYEMLTGRPPFRGSTALETVHLMLSQEPLPPTRLRRDLPRDLETVCLHCLQRDPSRRYASAAAFAEDLQRFLDRRPILARPTSALERAWKWSRREPATAALGSGFVVLLILSFALILRGWRNAAAEEVRRGTERDRALLLADAETAARHRAEQLSTRLLMERGASLCESGDYATGLHWLVRCLETMPPHCPTLEHSAHWLTAGWQCNLHPLQSAHFHPDEVSAVAFANDSQTLAVAVDRRVWLHTSKPDNLSPAPRPPVLLPGNVLHLAASRDRLLAVIDLGANRVQVCSLPEGVAIGPVIRLSSAPVAVTLSRDGSILLVGLARGEAWAFRVREGTSLAGPLPHQGSVGAIAISPNGRSLLTGAKDGQLYLWSARDGKLERTLVGHRAPITSVAFHHDGKRIISGCEDRLVMVWQRATGQKQFQIPHDKHIAAVAAHPRLAQFATATDDGRTRLWDLDTGQPIGAPMVHYDDMTGIAFSPDGRLLATASKDWSARVWRLARPTSSQATFPHPSAVSAVAVIDKDLLTACSDGGIRRWNPATGKQRLLTELPTPLALAVHAASRTVAVGCVDSGLYLLDADSGVTLAGPWAHGAAVQAVAISPDGTLVATGCNDPDWVIRVFDLPSGRLVHELIGHDRKIGALAFHPHGHLLLSSSWDFTARLWDMRTGKPVGDILKHSDLVKGVAFSPDGKTALTASDDYTSRLWHVPSGKPRGRPQLHPDKVEAVAFSPTGSQYATAGKTGRVRLWDLETGRLIGQPQPHDGEVHSLAFLDAGRTLVSGSWKGDVCTWPVPAPVRIELPVWRRWLEIHTAAELDADGALVPLDKTSWERLFRQYVADTLRPTK